MEPDWTPTTMGAAFHVNPLRNLSIGTETVFVPMDAISEHQRLPDLSRARIFTGSGTKFRNGDTLLARITPCLENGKTAFVAGLSEHDVAHGSTEYIVLSGRNEYSDNLFAYYVCRSPDFRAYAISHMEGTSGRQRVPAIAVANYQLSLPGLYEQQRIADILGTLDDKIELNRRTSETLEAIARAIFKSWFIDFDPVLAKAKGRPTKLPQEICDLFPAKLEIQDGRMVPLGWRFGSINALVELNPESWTVASRPNLIRYVDLSNTKWGRIEATTPHTASSAPSRAQRVLRPGDTLIGTVRPGNGSFAMVSEDGLTGSTGFAVLRPKKAIFTAFTYLAATLPERIQELAHLADGAAYPAVRPEVVANQLVVISEDGVLAAFERIVGPLLNRIAIAEAESATLAEIRDSLLPKLIGGELVSGAVE